MDTVDDPIDSLQRRADEARRQAEAAGLRSLTLERAVADARDALVGIPREFLTGSDDPWWDVVSRDNRLRGLGVILLAAGTLGMLLSAL